MASLLFTSGEQEGKRVEVERNELTIGRAPDNDVVIDDASVSSRHCVLLRNQQRYTLRDLGSTNGTTVNDFPIRETRLQAGDVLVLGNVEFRFEGEDIEANEVAPDSAGSAARPATVRTTAATVSPTPFGTKRQSRKAWNVAILVVIMLAVAAATWFISRLFD